MSFAKSYQYIVDRESAAEALGAFAHQPIVGLDTETYWDRATRQNRISLLQLAAPTGEVIVLDALAAGLEESRDLIENPTALMAAHNARFDEGALIGAGLKPAGLVDTLRLARRLLRLPSCSLTAVTEHLFGFPLDKRFQQSNWRRRPLTREQLDYAALDAQAALRVYQTLTERLAQEGRLEAELRRAQLDLARAAQPEPVLRSSRRPSLQLRPLTAEERQLFEQLRAWRRQLAEREHLPVYMVCPDKTLEHLAIVRPCSLDELSQIFGLGPLKIAKYGPALLKVLQARLSNQYRER